MIPAVLGTVLGVLAANSPDPRGDLAKRLAMPLSPGAVALLAPHAHDAAAIARLSQALRDARSETRAAAARIVTTAPLPELQQPVSDALAAETDAEAAREEIRALAAVAQPRNDEILFAASDRFDQRLDPDLAKILARARGPAAMSGLLFGRKWNLTATEWANAVWIAARGNAESMQPAVARALGDGDIKRWDALLDLFEFKNRVVARSVVAAGLSSSNPEIAVRSALYLAWARQTEPIDSDRETFGRVEPPEGAGVELTFSFELMHRSFDGPGTTDIGWVGSLAEAKKSLADQLLPGSQSLALLTADEREAVRERYNKRNGVSPKEAEEARGGWTKARVVPARRDRPFVFRTFSGLPRAVAADAIAVGKCRPPSKEIFGVAAVWYAPDGRPRQVRSYESPASDACEAVALALAGISLARDDEFPIGEAPDFLFGAARSDCLSVLDELEVCPSVCPEDRDQTLQVGGRVTAPRLSSRVEPRYPEGSRVAGKQGVVVIEAIIGVDGCIAEVSVLDGVDSVLDVEAARAVAQWKYQPARIGDRPVRVYLTVSVTFRLTR